MLDEQLFDELKDLYRANVAMFKQQNTGYFIEKVHPLTMLAVERAIGVEGYIDKKYIHQHFKNFTINPQITEISKGFTTRIEISPDISWEVSKGGMSNDNEEV